MQVRQDFHGVRVVDIADFEMDPPIHPVHAFTLHFIETLIHGHV